MIIIISLLKEKISLYKLNLSQNLILFVKSSLKVQAALQQNIFLFKKAVSNIKILKTKCSQSILCIVAGK